MQLGRPRHALPCMLVVVMLLCPRCISEMQLKATVSTTMHALGIQQPPRLMLCCRA